MVLTVNLSRDDLNAIHAHRHLGGVGGGDAAVRTVHDGTVEGAEHAVAVGGLTLGESEDDVRAAFENLQVTVRDKADSGVAEVVRVDARHQGGAGRSTIDKRDHGSGGDASGGEGDRHVLVLVTVNPDVEHVGFGGELVGVTDGAIQDRRDRSDLLGDASHAQDYVGATVDRHEDRAGVGRDGAASITRGDGEVADLNATTLAVEVSQRDLTGLADGDNGASSLVLLGDLLVHRRTRTADDFEVLLLQKLVASSDDDRDANTRENTGNGRLEKRAGNRPLWATSWDSSGQISPVELESPGCRSLVRSNEHFGGSHLRLSRVRLSVHIWPSPKGGEFWVLLEAGFSFMSVDRFVWVLDEAGVRDRYEAALSEISWVPERSSKFSDCAPYAFFSFRYWVIIFIAS